MNPEFRVLTNANDRANRTPVIQDRFRKLTLQSPRRGIAGPKSPSPSLPQSKLASEKIVQPPHKSQTQSETVTNKLMLSTSSGDNTQQTNFINVETEPFSQPLQIVESTDSPIISLPITENAAPAKNVDNNALAAQMGKLEVSRVSVDLFSQQSSGSKLSVPPNRILSNKENIESLSQRMSNIHVSDNRKANDGELADTQPNTSSEDKRKSLGDTQLNTSPIVLISDGEDSDHGNDVDDRADLLTEEETEESEDESVIELLSSDDEITEVYIQQKAEPVPKCRIGSELTESAVEKLNHFFDNIPNLNASLNNYSKVNRNLNDSTDLTIPETKQTDSRVGAEQGDDEINVAELEASQLEPAVAEMETLIDKQGNDTADSSSLNSNGQSPQRSRVNESETSRVEESSNVEDDSSHVEESSRAEEDEITESSVNIESDEEESVRDDSTDQSSNEKQMSVPVTAAKKSEFDKIKTSATKNVITLKSPVVNISARVNIKIRLSGFSTNSSDTDATSETADDQTSDQSSKHNQSTQSDVAESVSGVRVAHCRPEGNENPASDLKLIRIGSPTHKLAPDEYNPHHDRNNEASSESSIIESSIVESSQMKFGSERDVSGLVQSFALIDMEGNEMSPSDFLARNASAERVENSTATDSSSSKDVDRVAEGSDTLPIVDTSTPVTDGGNDATVSHTDTSIEIDEIGEQLLTDLYGDAWKTPQLIKKCASVRKKCLTDVLPRRCQSRGFSLFQSEVPSELESTRIGCKGNDDDESDQSQPQLTPAKENSNGDANQSSRIIRTRRKGRAPANRILEYSADDDDDSSDADSSFDPLQSDSESDISCEELAKPRKRSGVVFLDLTSAEVIEDEDHVDPDATPTELEQLVETFLHSLETQKTVQTPAPTKRNVPTTTTKRKLFTPNYDDETPFDDRDRDQDCDYAKKNQQSDSEKFVQLKTPIPSYLIPPQYRDKSKIFTPSKGITPKKCQTPGSPAPLQACGFLESLDEKLIPTEYSDPDALLFRNRYKENRQLLVKRLMKIYNHYIFDNKLSHVPVSWSKKLTKTAGICKQRKMGQVRKAAIELSEKVLTTADRVRDTLVHELCHAAAWIVDKDRGGHGKIWKYWADRANKKFPELPKIVRCHNYEISYKYTYKCAMCGLKSQAQTKSKKIENVRCASCHGPIELFENKTDKDGNVVLVPPKEPSIFAKFVKKNYNLYAAPGFKHADVMKTLSSHFGKLTVAEKAILKEEKC